MSDPRERLLSALKQGVGLQDEFNYYLSWEDYVSYPDPLPRTKFEVREVQETILRYPNPEKPKELYRWDIHGRVLVPE
ncbi:MAG: hypothetical protein V3T60_07810, partial [Candidatus Binatia bacterium]